MSSTRLPCRLWAAFALVACLLSASSTLAQAPSKPETDLLEQARRTNEVLAQKAEADLRQALRDSQRIADAPKAIERLKRALAALEQDSALTPARRETLVRMVKERIRSAETEADRSSAGAAALDEKQAQASVRRSVDDRASQEAERTRDRVKEVNALRKEGRTEDATRVARDLAKEQPRNPAAQASSRSAAIHEQADEARKLKNDAATRRIANLREAERSNLLPSGDVEFPKDWRERTKNRKTTIALTPKEKAILSALSTPVTVNFRGTRFEDVVEYLQTLTGQPVLLDKPSLDESQVGYDTPITANVKGVTVRTLLRKILSEMNLTYVVRDEAIQVTSAARAREMMVVRSYYIADVVAGVGPQDPLQIIRNINSITDMIQNSVDPQSWRQNGGSGTITFSAGTMSLVIKQSAEVHAILGSGGLLR